MARTTVEAQIEKLRKAKAEIEKKEKELLSRSQNGALAKIVELAKSSGITAVQIQEALRKGKGQNKEKASKARGAARGKVAPKYRNPANSQETWTGRGRAPLWAKQLREAGNLDGALIAKT